MSVTPSSNVVGVFTDRASAEQAIEALYNAGFARESIRYSVPDNAGDGTFLGGIKSLFTGNDTQSQASSLANDLSNMGLSSEEVQYYTNEYTGGHTILAVNASDRGQDVLSVLHQYGAYGTGSSGSLSSDSQPTDQRERFDNTGAQAQDEAYQNQDPQASHAFEDYQHNTAMPEHDSEDQTAQATANDQEDRQSSTGYQQYQTAGQDEVSAPDQRSATEDQNADVDQQEQPARTDTTAPDQQATQYDAPDRNQQILSTAFDPSEQYAADNQATQNTSPYQTDELHPVDTSSHQANDQSTQASKFTPAYATNDHQANGFAPQAEGTQAGTAAPNYPNKLQSFQQQLEDAQRRLEETKSQLQTAKEHEGQLQAAKQRLQEIQAELQAAQAELHETRTRIEQY